MADYQVKFYTVSNEIWTHHLNQDTKNRLLEANARGNRFFSFTAENTEIYINLDNIIQLKVKPISEEG